MERPCTCKAPYETLSGTCARCKRRLRLPSEIRLATDVKDWRGGRAKMEKPKGKPCE